jgi:hypothetical protein
LANVFLNTAEIEVEAEIIHVNEDEVFTCKPGKFQ